MGTTFKQNHSIKQTLLCHPYEDSITGIQAVVCLMQRIQGLLRMLKSHKQHWDLKRISRENLFCLQVSSNFLPPDLCQGKLYEITGVDKFKVQWSSHCGLVLNEVKNNALAHPNNVPYKLKTLLRDSFRAGFLTLLHLIS